ncbi:DUF6701 domain-containing protein [Oceanisphaera ostreae]|uniref:DUF6701 domain-containing protein n=1 Tax=Oceanisphaera ostreae TaxID=914151 RepID=A0ABW3KCX1_9GAMM
MNIKNLVLAITLFSIFSAAQATESDPKITTTIAELFPFAAQSNDEQGEIDMDDDSYINGTNNRALDFKFQDDLDGACDGKKCTLSNEIGLAALLPTYKPDLVEFPSEFKENKSSRELQCTKSNQSKSDSDNDFKKIKLDEKNCEITLTSTSDSFHIKELKVEGGGTLTLPAGDYWIEDLDIDGGQLNIDGDANFYIYDEVNIKNAGEITGLNIYAPNKDIRIEKTKFTGGLFTNKKLEVKGSKSDVSGRISADKLVLKGKLNLAVGNYHFHEIELKKKSNLETVGPVTLYIESELDLKEKAELGSEDQPVTIFVYGQENLYVNRDDDDDDDDDKDDGEVDLDKGAKIYGFVYVEGELDLDESAGIYGAVNVIHLDMDKKSFIDNGTQAGFDVDHYELHFNSCNAQLVVKACGDAICSPKNLYRNKATVHVKNQGEPYKNLYKFKDFEGLHSTNITEKAEQLEYQFELGYHSSGKGNLDPQPKNDLVCYVDGVRTCFVERRYNGSNDGELTLRVDTAYASGMAPISLTGGCLIDNEEVEVEFGFDGNESGKNKSLTIMRPGYLAVDVSLEEKKSLTLPLNGASIRYPVADLLTLSIKKKLPDETYGDKLTDKVAFVPKSWQVQNPVNCGDEDGFEYIRDAETCTVLAAVGDDVNFGISALDINNKPLSLDWLKEKFDTDSLIQAVTKHPHKNMAGNITLFKLNDEDDTKSQHTVKPDIVGAVEIITNSWEADYIPDGDAKMPTSGESKYIGRAVPVSLRIKKAESGDITGNVVYAAHPAPITFNTTPSFTVQGLDTQGKVLPSYSGEFSSGLDTNSQVQLATKLSNSELSLIYSEPETGKHLLKVDTADLAFIKDEPFAETDLSLPLILTIYTHDSMSGVTGNTTLAAEEDKLRFGFLSLDGLELPVGQAGEMKTHLNYYLKYDSKEINTVNEDSDFPYELTASNKPVLESSLSPSPQLRVTAKELEVPAYEQPWKGTVKIKVPHWLKPDTSSDWIVPATLTITSDARKRGNDRVFNRREVVR